MPHRGDSRPARLCRRFSVERLNLFGSAATGEFDPDRSDLDFLVRFAPLAPAAYADAFFGLRDRLAELFERPVDLLTESALANPYFRERVLAERRTLYDAS